MAEPHEPMPNLLTGIRASDAERAEVGDVLTKHFMDGRLDRAEFDQRLESALGAKTRGELTALLHDLPRVDARRPAPPQAPRRTWRLRAPLGLVCLVGCAVLAAAALFGRSWRAAGGHPGSGGSIEAIHSSQVFSLVPVLVVAVLLAGVCLAVHLARRAHERR